MITVETKPERALAVQWNQEGDGSECGEQSYLIGTEKRWGIPTMAGLQRLHPGDWIVLGNAGEPRVFTASEFHYRFRIVEEGQTS